MIVPSATLSLARASLGLTEVTVDAEAYTILEWAAALELSVEKTRALLQQGVFDSIFERKDVLRTMEVGDSSNAYLERDCYKYIEED